MNKKIFPQKNYGFTLAETLVSIVILLLIIMIISGTFLLNQKVTHKNNLKAELMQNARIVSDLMAREIRQAKEIVTVLPADNSNPTLVPHELLFQDGHNSNQIQYVRYYLDGNNLNRQIVIYYFATDPNIYVYWNDVDAFGGPLQGVLEDKLIGENFSGLDFYGSGLINIDLALRKTDVNINFKTIIKPRNI